MPDVDDIALLREYVERNSESAFAGIVERRVNLVYSVALRFTGNSEDAQDVTQAVFVILARKAAGLRPKTILTGWLYEATRFTAMNFLTRKNRRQAREQEAYMQSTLNEAETTWPQLAPLLESAMSRLNEKDRTLVALRFFENRSMAETAALLGVNEPAARKRAERVIERLRAYFSKRGVTSTAETIAATISANSVQAAPTALAKSVTAVAIAKGAAASTSTLTLIKGALKIMAWTKAKTAIVAGAGLLLVVGTTTVTVKEISHHREESVWSHITRCDLKQMESAPPTVSIRPTRYTSQVAGAAGSVGKILALHQPFDVLLARAYDVSPCRILSLTPLPQGDFDFIASVPQRQKEALQELIRQKFGITARRETRETDVLLLTLKRPGAPGLKPTSAKAGNSFSSDQVGHWRRTDGPIDYLIYDLQYYLQVPIIDRTGLTGRFDVDLTWDDEKKWDDTGHYSFSNPDGLKQALLDQIGLELAPSREPTEMVVVEKAK